MASFGNALISTPAASRGGTANAKSTPRQSAPPSALKKSGTQSLPTVVATSHISFEPNSTRALAARQAKAEKNVVVKFISVTGDDVTLERLPKPRSFRHVSSTGDRGASPLRDRGISFRDQVDGGRVATEYRYKPAAAPADRYKKPTGDTPPPTPRNRDLSDDPEPPLFPPRSWQVKRLQKDKDSAVSGFASIEKEIRKQGRAAILEVERHVVSQMQQMLAQQVQHDRLQSQSQAAIAKAELLEDRQRTYQATRLEQHAALIHRQKIRQPPPEVAAEHRAKDQTTQARIESGKAIVYAQKAAAVVERKREIQDGQIVVEKTKEARDHYYRYMQEDLGIKHPSIRDRRGA